MSSKHLPSIITKEGSFKMKTLYFDCFSGISGDMVIGALIDAGGDPQHLTEELKKLQMEDEYELQWETVDKNGITCTKFDVVLTDHTKHEHHHTDHHHHDHRAYREIVQMIQEADFTEAVLSIALNIFKKIGEAEGLIHGVPLEEVHFHEVGAVDSIIDIVGTAILLESMNIEQVKSSTIPVGSGQIHIDHGIYPVPAPATLEILRGIPLEQSDIQSELTTPTGAAIIAVLSEEYCPFPTLTVDSIGYGAGTKSFPNHPNVLRVVIGE